MRINACIVTCLFIALAYQFALADNWPQWRGPNSNGIINESSNWPNAWPPKEIWRKQVGKGCTSPIIADGKLYVMGWQGPDNYRNNPQGKDVITCYDAKTGKVIWSQSYPARYQSRVRTGDERMYGGPSATPTYDTQTGMLYTLGVDGELACWDANNEGRRVWHFNLHDKYTIKRRPASSKGQRDYGMTCSPYIFDNQLIVEVGAAQGTVISFDKRSGKELWKSQYNREAGHTGGFAPLLANGQPALALLALHNLVVFHASGSKAGRTIATTEWITDYSCNIPTPTALASQIAVTSGYNRRRTTLFELKNNELQRRWRVREHAAVSSPVVHDGMVFTVNNQLQANAVKSGQSLWKHGRFEHGSCLVTKTDNKIIAFGRGRLALYDAKSGKELSHVDNIVRGVCYPHIALSDGIIAVKDREGSMAIFSLREDVQPSVVRQEKSVPALAEDSPMPKVSDAWPGNQNALVFAYPGAELQPRGNGEIKNNVMHLNGGALLADHASQKLLAGAKASNQFAIEAIVTPNKASQIGPARIISFSLDPYKRNFTLGQDGNQLTLRLRTTQTGENGLRPQTKLFPITEGQSHHIIVSYQPGRLTAYLNGQRVIDTDQVQGDFSTWDAHHLLFGNEWKDERPWLGTLEKVAIHTRVIGAREAAQRYELASGKKIEPIKKSVSTLTAAPQTANTADYKSPTKDIKVFYSQFHQGCECYRIETPNGIWLYDKNGGGFAALYDKDGNDWISYRPRGGSAGNYRGIPNLAVFHPGQKNCVSRLVPTAGDKIIIETKTKDDKWACRWVIDETKAQFTLTKAAGTYWFLYEGTPGGMFNKNDGQCLRSGGLTTPLGSRWAKALQAPSWVAFTSKRTNRAIVLIHHEADVQIDSYWPMQNNMTVFGFGRDGRTMKTYMDKTPATFTVLLVDNPTAASIQKLVTHTTQK